MDTISLQREIASLQQYLGSDGTLCFVLPCEYNNKVENYLLNFALLTKDYQFNTLVCIPAHFENVGEAAQDFCLKNNLNHVFLNYANGAIEEFIDLALTRQIKLFLARQTTESLRVVCARLGIPRIVRAPFFKAVAKLSREEIALKLFRTYNNACKTDSIQETNTTPTTPSVKYQSHVQDIGWQSWVQDGALSGTVLQFKRLEAIKIELLNPPSMMRIKYQLYLSGKGWQDWVYDGEVAGTTAQAQRTEAIRISLENAPTGWSVWYKAHVQEFGWQPWGRNGDITGSITQGRRLEALRIQLDDGRLFGKGSVV